MGNRRCGIGGGYFPAVVYFIREIYKNTIAYFSKMV